MCSLKPFLTLQLLSILKTASRLYFFPQFLEGNTSHNSKRVVFSFSVFKYEAEKKETTTANPFLIQGDISAQASSCLAITLTLVG